ncbi:MAG: SOS response-associated peptidase [Phycisphaerales bacterium]|nr:SOS response-associated peptidase [Phycisphaerales bacterium]
MCGRYALLITWKELHRLMRLTTLPGREPALPFRYNIAPGQDAPVIRSGDAGPAMADLHWGMTRAADPARTCINARSESAARLFGPALRERRCVIPASGFYEWERGTRRPFYFAPPGGEPLLMAALWEPIPAPASFAILTRPAAGAVRAVHDRMPILLDPGDAARWLGALLTLPGAQAMLSAEPPALGARSVSPWVNSAVHEGPRCHEPARQGSLWDGPGPAEGPPEPGSHQIP